MLKVIQINCYMIRVCRLSRHECCKLQKISRLKEGVRVFQTCTVNSRKETNIFSPPTNRYSDSYKGLYQELSNEEMAKAFVYTLNPVQRNLLYKNLHEFDESHSDTTIDPLTRKQLNCVFLIKCLPFIGFGFLDNLIMIIAGEYIDMMFGAVLGISTMAAAGLGNCLSDIAGVGSATYIERLCAHLGVRPPALTAQQINSRQIRWTSIFGKIVGVTIGCMIGMCPLLFFKQKDKSEPKSDSSHS